MSAAKVARGGCTGCPSRRVVAPAGTACDNRAIGARSTAVRLVACVLCAQALLCASALADDRGALQAAALFQQSCVRFAGHPDLLRGWIGTHALPRLPAEQSGTFSGGHPAQSFGAGTADGPMVLVSEDSGACRVVVEHQSPTGVEEAVVSILTKTGVSVSLVGRREKPEKVATQSLYKASIASRHWLLSVTSHAHGDAPGTLPEVILLATVDNG
jgi:hypothetical protein